MPADDSLREELARVTAERDADIAHLLDVRNRVLRIAAAEVLPGPDGQDDLDRERLIQRWLDEARDETELARPALYEAQFRAVRAEAERDALREALEEAEAERDALREALEETSARAKVLLTESRLGEGAVMWLSVADLRALAALASPVQEESE